MLEKNAKYDPEKTKYDPALIVKRILRLTKNIEPGGIVSFPGSVAIGIGDVLLVLFSAVDFEVDLPENEKKAIISQAVSALATRQDLQPQHLLAEISKRATNYLRQPEKKFYLASSLSIQYFPELRNKRLDSASFSFYRFLPRKFDRSPLNNRFALLNLEQIENQYAIVITAIEGRSPEESASRGLDSLDLLRGIWNLFLNMHTSMRMSNSEQPVNPIRFGQIHTVHGPDGKLATNTFLHESDFVAPNSVERLTNKWMKLQNFERRVRNRLRQTNPESADFISDAIRRYVRALDEKKLDNSFLKLWSLIELLTGTIAGPYDRTIKRVVFRYQEPDWERQVLELLRDQRNRAVHHMESIEESEKLAYLLKRYVERLLVFHLTWSNRFSSLEECWQYLDMPRDKVAVKKKLKLARMALKLIDEREKT
jgi:hypothetical protein